MENGYGLYNACVEKDLNKIEVILGGMKKTSKVINNILREILSNTELDEVSTLLLKKLKTIKRSNVQRVIETKNVPLILLASKCKGFTFNGLAYVYELDLETFKQVFDGMDVPQTYHLSFEFATHITLENLKYLIEECGLNIFDSESPYRKFAILGYAIEMGRIDICEYMMNQYNSPCNCENCGKN